MNGFEWLAGLPPAVLLQQSGTAYLLVNAAHIACIGILVGSIVSLDLRLLGAGPWLPLAQAGPFLSRVAATGLMLAIITGIWLFSTQPDEYIDNTAFLVKMSLLALGVLNALWLHARNAWRTALQSVAVVPLAVRLHALASLLIWLAAILAGRWIAFL